MPTYRFITPETVVLPIGDGDTITIRRRLSAGQRMDLNARTTEWYTDDQGRQRPRLRLYMTALETVVAYLVDWTLVDADGQPIEVAGLAPDDLADTIRNLEEATFTAIHDAIETHAAQDEAAREAQKKIPAPAAG